MAESGENVDVNRKLLTLSTDGRWKTQTLHKVHFLRFAYLTEKEGGIMNVLIAGNRQKDQKTSKFATEFYSFLIFIGKMLFTGYGSKLAACVVCQ